MKAGQSEPAITTLLRWSRRAFKDGYDSRHEGMPLDTDHGPIAANGVLVRQWRDGWLKADAELRDTTDKISDKLKESE